MSSFAVTQFHSSSSISSSVPVKRVVVYDQKSLFKVKLFLGLKKYLKEAHYQRSTKGDIRRILGFHSESEVE